MIKLKYTTVLPRRFITTLRSIKNLSPIMLSLVLEGQSTKNVFERKSITCEMREFLIKKKTFARVCLGITSSSKTTFIMRSSGPRSGGSRGSRGGGSSGFGGFGGRGRGGGGRPPRSSSISNATTHRDLVYDDSDDDSDDTMAHHHHHLDSFIQPETTELILKQRKIHYKSSLREMDKIASVARASGSQLTEAQVRKARFFFLKKKI